jgi:hypothetical protein
LFLACDVIVAFLTFPIWELNRSRYVNGEQMKLRQRRGSVILNLIYTDLRYVKKDLLNSAL